jgi:hypothetical protein
LRDYGKKLNQGVLTDASKVDNQTEIARLEKELELQNTELNTLVEQLKLLSRTHLFFFF